MSHETDGDRRARMGAAQKFARNTFTEPKLIEATMHVVHVLSELERVEKERDGARVEADELRRERDRECDYAAMFSNAIDGIGRAIGMEGEGLLEDPSSAALPIERLQRDHATARAEAEALRGALDERGRAWDADVGERERRFDQLNASHLKANDKWFAAERALAAALARVRELEGVLTLARDWTEPFRGTPSMSKDELHNRLLVALASPKEESAK